MSIYAAKSDHMTSPNPVINQFIQQFLDIPLHKHLNLSLKAIHDNGVEVTFPIAEHLIGNPFTQILHGGCISGALDAVCGLGAALAICAKNPNLGKEDIITMISKLTTVNFNINYLRPGKGEWFCAKASTLRSGNHITMIQFELTNERQHCIAVGSANFFSAKQ